MPENYYDKASRQLAALDPSAFLSWLLNLPPADFAFQGWIDTRGVPSSGGADRTADTVARVADVRAHGVPWAVVIEFQIQPDADMFGRLLDYLSGVWRYRRPDETRGSHFQLGAVVVNLTGNGDASRDMHWPAAGLRTQLVVAERNLETEPAADLLAALEAGRWSRCLVPWVPLMAGADAADIIDRWKVVAGAEPDRHRRGQFGAIALLFARRVGRGTIWDEKLKEWNVEESTYVNEWIAKGEARGKEIGEVSADRSNLLRLGAKKFGAVPEAAVAAVQAISDRSRLERMLDRIFDTTATDWADLLATA